MESRKLKTILTIAVSVSILLCVALIFAAFIYCGLIDLSASSSVAAVCSVGGTFIFSVIEPQLFWMAVWGVVVVIIICVVLSAIIISSGKNANTDTQPKPVHATSTSQPAAAREEQLSAAPQTSPGMVTQVYAQGLSPTGPAPTVVYVPMPKGEDSDIDDFNYLQNEEADYELPELLPEPKRNFYSDELLAKHIRDVNQAAEDLRAANRNIATLLKKRKDRERKADIFRQQLFETDDVQQVNNCSTALSKLYKLLAKYDAKIIENKKKKADVQAELSELRRDANTYISIYNVPLKTVTAIEDEILYDLTLSRLLVEESEYFPDSIEYSATDAINDKLGDLTEYEADVAFWSDSLDCAADDETKLEMLVKLFEAEDKLESSRDELGGLMCRITDEKAHKTVEEITEIAKRSVVPGSGIVTRDRKKITSQKKKR